MNNTHLFQISGIFGLFESLGGGQDMATGDAEDCNLLMQFVVDADNDRPFFSQFTTLVDDVGRFVVVTDALEKSYQIIKSSINDL